MTVAAALLVGAALLGALLLGGGRPVAPTAGLPDAGAVTGWGRPVVDLLVRVLAVLTVGQLVHAALLAPAAVTGSDRVALRAVRGAGATAAAWLLAEGAALVLTASALYGVPVTALSPQGVAGLLTGLPVGRVSLWVGALLVVVVVGCLALVRSAPGPGAAPGPDGRPAVRWGAPLLLLAALAAVVLPVVLAGHSSAADDHLAAVGSLSVHVVTASLWVGGLAALLLHGRPGPTGPSGSTGQDPATVTAVVRRFSTLALGCVVVLTASGSAAALLVAGPPAWSWTGEGWARLLLLKTALLLVLAGLGWWHRRRTLPALAAGRRRAFVRLGVGEVVLMGVTLAVSVALSASPTPSSTPEVSAPGVTAGDVTTGDVAPADVAPADVAAADVAAGVGDPTDAAPGAVEDPAAGASSPPAEDMSGHDHGDLSVSVLVDAERFHVSAPVRPGQPVTVYNSSDAAATVTARDGGFDVEVPARTFITFPAPDRTGDHPFVSRVGGVEVTGFADVLRVQARA